jgi:hypothetical protein
VSLPGHVTDHVDAMLLRLRLPARRLLLTLCLLLVLLCHTRPVQYSN